MKSKGILCVLITGVAAASSLGQTVSFQDGGYHRLDETYVTVEVRNNFWDEPTTVEVVSGGAINNLYVYDDAQVIVSGGTIGNLYGQDTRTIVTESYFELIQGDSTVTISGGTITDSLYADGSDITISGGSIGGNLSSDWDSKVSISGGLIQGDISIKSCYFVSIPPGGFMSSEVTISGGTIGGSISIYGTLIVHGKDFVISGQSFPLGGTFDSGGLAERPGSVTCILGKGDPMNNNFTIYDDGAWSHGSLVLVPEPSTLLLTVATAALILRKRVKNRTGREHHGRRKRTQTHSEKQH